MLSLDASLNKLREINNEIGYIQTTIDNLSVNDINPYDYTEEFNDYLDRNGSIDGRIYYPSELLENFDIDYVEKVNYSAQVYKECLKNFIQREFGIKNTDEYYDLEEQLNTKKNEYNNVLEDIICDFDLTIDEVESRLVD